MSRANCYRRATLAVAAPKFSKRLPSSWLAVRSAPYNATQHQHNTNKKDGSAGSCSLYFYCSLLVFPCPRARMCILGQRRYLDVNWWWGKFTLRVQTVRISIGQSKAQVADPRRPRRGRSPPCAGSPAGPGLPGYPTRPPGSSQHLHSTCTASSTCVPVCTEVGCMDTPPTPSRTMSSGSPRPARVSHLAISRPRRSACPCNQRPWRTCRRRSRWAQFDDHPRQR